MKINSIFILGAIFLISNIAKAELELLEPLPLQSRIRAFSQKVESRVDRVVQDPNLNETQFFEWKSNPFTVSHTDSFSLKLENGTRASIQVKKSFVDKNGYLRISGIVKDDPRGNANFVISNSGVNGHLSVGGKSYTIWELGENLHVAFNQKETKQQALNHHKAMKQFTIKSGSAPSKTLVNDSHQENDIRSLSSINTIDLMVVYTDDVAGVLADPAATIQSDVDYTNSALEDSCVNFRYDLVHTAEVAYNETASGSTDLTALQATADGAMDGVHALRATYNADLVQVWVNTSDVCGVGYKPDDGQFAATAGFSLKLVTCAASTTAHELGHNLGLNHDRFQTENDRREETGSLSGHGFVDVYNKTRTIMSYDDHCEDLGFSCERIRIFSNPKIIKNGVKQGERSFTDSAGRMNETFEDVANYVDGGSSDSSEVDVLCVSEASAEKDVHCFIATAAYGSYMHDSVMAFRNFRDQKLKGNKIGEWIIRNYYQTSPRAAKFIDENPSLKPIARFFLGGILFAITYPLIAVLTLVFAIMFLVFQLQKKKLVSNSSLTALVMLVWLAGLSSPAQASVSKQSYFENQLAINPAAVKSTNPNHYFGFSYGQTTGALTEDERSTAVSKGTAMSFHSGFQWTTGAVRVSHQPLAKTTEDSEVDSLDEASDEFGFGYTQLNVGMQLFEGVSGGFKYRNAQSTALYDGVDDTESTLQTEYGFGGVWIPLPGFQFGAGFDYVTESGDELATASWITPFFGLGFTTIGTGAIFSGEFSYKKAPRVLAQDEDLVNFHSDTATTSIRFEVELGIGGTESGVYAFGFGYSEEAISAYDEYIDEKLVNKKVMVDFGTLFFQKSLLTSISYVKNDSGYGAKFSDSTIGVNLIYRFGSAIQ